jgi:hypothetical protein
MGDMNRYEVCVVPWEHGWELHVDGVGVTQVEDLSDVDAQVRSLVQAVLEVDASDAVVAILR